jgi:energy-coupling factor transport system permease protein
LTYTTSPISLTDGLESLLSPLKKVNVPVHTFAMMMSIALRFIPTLIEETEKIMNAQKSRGADFTSGTLVQRAKSLIPLLVPLFISSFKRAEELATAMECRCYRGDNNRTKLVKLEYKGLDFVFILLFVIILVVLICLAIVPYNLQSFGFLYDVLFYRV